MAADFLSGGQVAGDPNNDDCFRWYGDVNGDGSTNFCDFASGFLPAFGTSVGDSNYDESLDADGDGNVNFAGSFLPKFGTSRP